MASKCPGWFKTSAWAGLSQSTMDTNGRGKYSKVPLSWQHLGVGRLSQRPVGEERASRPLGRRFTPLTCIASGYRIG